jgi:hypothetical protein
MRRGAGCVYCRVRIVLVSVLLVAFWCYFIGYWPAFGHAPSPLP